MDLQDDVAIKIEKLILAVVLQLSRRPFERKAVAISRTATADEMARSFRVTLARRTERRFAEVLRTLSEVYLLVTTDQYSTKRDIFYQLKGFFGQQRALDRAVTAVCELLGERRAALHVMSTARGCMLGSARFRNGAGALIDCSAAAVQLDARTERLACLRSDARFVLVVEKDASFEKLVAERFVERFGPCLLVTGKGYPDLATRSVLRQIHTELAIPVFALVDADPHGVEIFLTYKYGARNSGFENEGLNVSSTQWIGIFPTELPGIPVPMDQFVALTEGDLKKVERLQRRADIQTETHIMSELAEMQRTGTKVEIEAVSCLRPNYLTDVYLRDKLAVSLAVD